MRQTQTYHSINQTKAYNRSTTIVTKVLGLYYIHGGITTTDMVVD